MAGLRLKWQMMFLKMNVLFQILHFNSTLHTATWKAAVVFVCWDSFTTSMPSLSTLHHLSGFHSVAHWQASSPMLNTNSICVVFYWSSIASGPRRSVNHTLTTAEWLCPVGPLLYMSIAVPGQWVAGLTSDPQHSSADRAQNLKIGRFLRFG